MSAVNAQQSAWHREGVQVHHTAIIERDVELGPNSMVWDNAHIRHGARIGSECIVGEKTYIAYDVRVGNRVKLNAMVYICAGVEIEDMVMIAAGATFTNDCYPRAMDVSLRGLETSDPTAETLHTKVCRGATIGANATVGPGITLGEFCMVGMGSVVTRSVPPFALVVGNPARLVGHVCVCGHRLARTYDALSSPERVACQRCERSYEWANDELTLASPLVLGPDATVHEVLY